MHRVRAHKDRAVGAEDIRLVTGNALKRAREEAEAFKKRYPHIVAWWKALEKKLK